MQVLSSAADDGKITIGFNYIDELGNVYNSESTVEVLYDINETDLDAIGRLFNIFLKQCGFYREGEYLLMDSLTEDELDAVSEFLDSYRSKTETPETE